MDSPRRKGTVSQPNVMILSQILDGLYYPKKRTIHPKMKELSDEKQNFA
jgi:hypothetical protein